VIVILLSLFMMPLKVIIREGKMVIWSHATPACRLACF
jgi:hypothetical protein